MELNVSGALGWLLIPWVIFALWRCWNVSSYLDNYREWKRRFDRFPAENLPPVVIWSAVKGVGEDYQSPLSALLNQDYPAYEIHFAVESVEDPAWDFFINFFGQRKQGDKKQSWRLDRAELEVWDGEISHGLQAVSFHLAGLSRDQGQKIHNLLACYRNDGGFGGIIALADADAHWMKTTLRALVQEMLESGCEFTTGYRWIVPAGRGLAMEMASAINGSIATLLGRSVWRRYAWAGALAIRRRAFEERKVAEFWKNKVNDDLSLMTVMGGCRHLAFCPGVTPCNSVDYDWPSFINFIRRQYIQAWVYCRPLWVYALLITSSYLMGWSACVIGLVLGHSWVLLPALIVYGSDTIRAGLRAQVTREMLPESAYENLARVRVLDRFFGPLVFLVHWLAILSTFGVTRMCWSGVEYRMQWDSTKILKRR